jgi:hypothetical protein
MITQAPHKFAPMRAGVPGFVERILAIRAMLLAGMGELDDARHKRLRECLSRSLTK